MARINLLPWREELRQERQRQFAMSALLTAITGVVIVFLVSLAFDPEGSGPDTHYKVLQVIAEALRMWSEEEDLSKLRIWGYRNVWYRFHPAEANRIVPVSLNAMGVMDDAFTNSYLLAASRIAESGMD